MNKAKIHTNNGDLLEVDYHTHNYLKEGIMLLESNLISNIKSPVMFIPHGLAIVEFETKQTPKIIVTHVTKTAFKTYKRAQNYLVKNGEKIYPDVFDHITDKVDIGDFIQVQVKDQKEKCFLRVVEMDQKKRVKICDSMEIAECYEIIEQVKE